MKFLLILIIIAGGYAAYRYKKKMDKKQDQLEKELKKIKESGESNESKNHSPKDDPCADKRDGLYNPNWTKQTCNKHGYFWCPIAKKCMPSSINVNECGKPPHLM